MGRCAQAGRGLRSPVAGRKAQIEDARLFHLRYANACACACACAGLRLRLCLHLHLHLRVRLRLCFTDDHGNLRTRAG